MSVTNEARTAAVQAADSKPLEMLARVGFITYGLTHLVVAWLAWQIASGGPTATGDQSGALKTLLGHPAGQFVVTATGVGLAAMAVWQLLEAAVGHRADRGRERLLERASSAARTVFYAYLAYTAYKVVKGGPSSADTQQSGTSELMSSSGGRTVVWLAGLGVLCFGAALVYYGLSRRFEKHLRMSEMSHRVRNITRRLGIVGYLAKGLAYGTAGALVIVAAQTFDPSKARGLDAALRAFAGQPYGTVLVAAVGAGIAAFAAFCFVQARYRKI
jgi:Domain of Unknown Function (DUF1206)